MTATDCGHDVCLDIGGGCRLAARSERTCRHCGHQRDVHGAYRAENGGWRCNTRVRIHNSHTTWQSLPRCDCPGFQPVSGSVAEALGADIVEPVEDAVARGAIPHDPRSTSR